MKSDFLQEKDLELIGELQSKFYTCKDRASYSLVMRELQKHLGFKYWSSALAEMEGEYRVTSNYTKVDNFPPVFMEAYVSNQAEFFDVIVLHHFTEKNFGALQRWKETYEITEREKDQLPPELYEKHQQWRGFLEEWGILLDGYSLGHRTKSEAQGKWYGSIINYSDEIDYSPRFEAMIQELAKAQHAALLKFLLPELI